MPGLLQDLRRPDGLRLAPGPREVRSRDLQCLRGNTEERAADQVPGLQEEAQVFGGKPIQKGVPGHGVVLKLVVFI